MKKHLILFCISTLLVLLSCKESPVADKNVSKEIVNSLSFDYRGEFDSIPANPLLNWVYRNTNDRCFYIYNGTKWVLLAIDGIDKINGVNIFVTFNNNPITNPPETPINDGTLPAGWHRTSTDSAVWISQKISADVSSGTWGAPIRIQNSGGIGVGRDAGFVYYEGFKQDLKCGTCHSANYEDTTFRIITKIIQYESSGHKELSSYDRNTTQCAGCHTNEGFYERFKNGFSNETFILNAPSGPITKQSYANSSPVGCFTCHSPHKNGNFVVRDSNAVKIFTIVAGQETKIVATTSSSSVCIKCHQPRMTSTFLIPGSTPTSWQPNPAASTTDTAKIYTTRWNNHGSGEQTQTLLGFGGFEFPGYVFENSSHTLAFNQKLLGCESCHMAAPIENKVGGHTFKVGYLPQGSTTLTYNFTGCNTFECHGSSGAITVQSAKWKNIRDEIGAKLTQLGMMMMDTTVTKKWSLPKNGRAVTWVSFTTNGFDTTWTVANATSTSPLQIIPAIKSGALWNFQQVLFERSKGIHNTKYARALLDASIAELNKP